MTSTQYPAPSTGSSTSTVLPVNASSVLLDGELTTVNSYTTTINGNGGMAYLTSTNIPAIITIGGTKYTVPINTVVTSKAFGASTSVTIASAGFSTATPSTFSSSTMPNAIAWNAVAYGNGYYVAVAGSNTTSGAYSTDGVNWTASTMPSSATWTFVAYGNGYFVAVCINSSAGAYSTNGTTWTANTFPSSLNWDGITYGNGKFVAVQGGGSSAVGAYFAQTQTLPVNFGIYAGPTTIN